MYPHNYYHQSVVNIISLSYLISIAVYVTILISENTNSKISPPAGRGRGHIPLPDPPPGAAQAPPVGVLPPRPSHVPIYHFQKLAPMADSIPPLGYESVVLNFNPLSPYPTSTTCALQLILPINKGPGV